MKVRYDPETQPDPLLSHDRSARRLGKTSQPVIQKILNFVKCKQIVLAKVYR